MRRTRYPEPIDRSAVKLTSSFEFAYWRRKLGLSRTELTSAVEAVGTDLQAVRQYIHRSRSISLPSPARRPARRTSSA
jgi:hypothetical protein